MPRYTVSLDEDLLSKFREMCGVEHTNCAEKIRELIKMYINSQNDNSLDEIYELIDRIVVRSGHITIETIQRHTNTRQEQEVIKYCKQKNYPIVSEKWYEEGPVHKWEGW
mgnify:CR=1 FL=1